MERTTAYMRLDEIAPADRNPKRHDDPEIRRSLRRFGYADTALLDERTQRLVGGHGRLDALRGMHADGEDAPEHVVVDDSGAWTVPIQRGWASTDDTEAEAAGIAFNRLTETGGWDPTILFGMLTPFIDTDVGLDGIGFDLDALDDLRAEVQEEAPGTAPDRTAEYARQGVKSFNLDYPLDTYAIMTANCRRLLRHREIETTSELIQTLVTEATATARAAEATA